MLKKRARRRSARCSIPDDHSAQILLTKHNLDIIHYRYIVNKTKNVYYDREAMPKRGVTSRFDPLPMLMGSAGGGLLVDGKPVPSFDGKNTWAAAPDGAWVGDVVVPTNEMPSGKYKDVSRRYSQRIWA